MTRLWSNLDPAAVVRNCPASEIEAILRDAVARINYLERQRDGLMLRLGQEQADLHRARTLAKAGQS